MNFNKIILISLLLLFVCLGAVSATDNVNSTDDLTVEEAVNELTVNNIDEEICEDLNADEGILKEESNSIVINNGTFNNYFDGEGRILDSVPEGATLDFQGQITSSDTIKAIYINKSVNIISSTKDATITLNTVNGTSENEIIFSRFVVDNVSSITINDVTFNRTQMIVYNSSNVILNNVKLISDNYRVVSGISIPICETPLVRLENITGLTLKNSHIRVYNLGSALVGCFDVEDAVFDNNAFHVYADSVAKENRVDGIINFRTHVPEYVIAREHNPDLRVVNTSVNITNNYFELNYTSFSGPSIYANNILFENNTYKHPDTNNSASIDGFSLSGTNESSIIVRNNNLTSISLNGNGIVQGNHIYKCSSKGSFLIYDNYFGSEIAGAVTLDLNSIFYNNTSIVRLSIWGNNVILKDSNIYSLTINGGNKNITIRNNHIEEINIRSTETYIYDNTINGTITIEKSGNSEIRNNIINAPINIQSSDCLIEFNVINAFDSDYGVYIKSGKEYMRNEVSDNEIYSKWYCGDNAVSHDENYLNFIEYNTPANQIGMFVNNAVDVFDYGGNTTISINVPGVKGNVTIDVDGKKYIVGLVNGGASYTLTKYSLGLNNVTVIYYDYFDDVWAIGHVNFTVNKVAYCPVELVYGTMDEFTPSNINFILPEDADGTISISLTDGFYSVDIEQAAKGGNNAILLPGLIEGNYTITATFTSVKYVTNSSVGIISFVHKPVYKLNAGNVVMNYNDGSKYKVLVTEDGKAVGAGENVKINLNGKTTEVKTDKNGYATLAVTNLPGKYTLTATYKGQTVKNTIQVKQNLKASKVTVKKSAKSFVLKATLSKIKGKKLTFKFKGKTYTAKTNKKGIAKVTIKKNIIKKLKKGKKYSFTVKYVSNTVKGHVTVK